MLCWQGACRVHDEFQDGTVPHEGALPDAAILVHPESPQSIVDMADTVFNQPAYYAARTLPHKQLIVATDRGIFTAR